MAHPAKTKVIAQAKLKDYKLDSSILTDLLGSGMIYESFVPSKYYRDLRSLVRTRIGCVHDATRHKNKIHAILAKYDYLCPTKGVFSKKGTTWLKLILISEIDRTSMDIHIHGHTHPWTYTSMDIHIHGHTHRSHKHRSGTCVQA